MPQKFVDQLNHKYMPQSGYVFFEQKWWRPVYDWDQHDHADFATKSYVKHQQNRLQQGLYESPDGREKIRRRLNSSILNP